jgi:uncharacterized membrane protein
VALTAATALADAVYSVLRHLHLQTGFDLALADQAVWHYSRFEAPFSSILDRNILGDHFSPLVAVLSPLYWLWSDPRMLLIAQSALIAGSIVPVFLYARPRIGRPGAHLLAAAYAVFWGIQEGVGYEFHELALAPILIASAILAVDRRRWGWLWCATALLLLVKEDMSMLVVFLGLYLVTLRELRRGLLLVAVGIAWYVVATRALIPDLSHGAAYAHWTYDQLGSNLGAALLALLRAPWRVFEIGFSPARKLQTITALLGTFLFLSLGSRLFILAIPLLAERFLSTDANFWGTAFHYSLTVSPVLAMGAADGLARIVRLLGEPRVRRLIPSGIARLLGESPARVAVPAATAAMLVMSLTLTLFAARTSALRGLFDPALYRGSSQASAALRALATIPASGSLATNDTVIPHASHRRQVSLIARATLLPDHMLADVGEPVGFATGNQSQQALGQVLAANFAHMTPVHYEPGWVVLARPPRGQRPSNGVLAPMPAALSKSLLTLGQAWFYDLLATMPRLAGCARRFKARDPGAADCASAAQAAFQARQYALVDGLGRALEDLNGGCLELGSRTLTETKRLAADLARLAPAARSADRSAFPAASAAVDRDDRDRDIPGQLQRFLILCSPRS